MLLNNIKFLQEQAEVHDVEPAMMIAVVEVESAGKVFNKIDGINRPEIRWEGHYFDRLIDPKLRPAARAAKLASPKMGAIKNPSSQAARYAILARGRKLDNDAALSSISIGVGQVMISHWKELGFSSPLEMFEYAHKGFEAQVDLMIRYIVRNNLMDELQRRDVKAFARGYNGKSFAKMKYDTRILAAYEKYKGEKAPVSKADGMLRMGSKGARVRELQKLLVRAGFTVKVDGDYGPSTRDAVKAAQHMFELEVDGVAGRQTMQALMQYKSAPDEDLEKPSLSEVDEAKTGGIGALSGAAAVPIINEAAEKIQSVAGESVFMNTAYATLTTLAVAITLAGLAYAAYGYWKAHRTVE